MFQLIVSVLAIALTSALALASMHYGGSILSGSAVRANVATLVNDGQQISNAVVLDGLDNPYQPVSLDRIPSIPIPPRVADTGAGWQVDQSGVTFIRLSQNAFSQVCSEIRQSGGIDDSISWSGPASASLALRNAGKMFGCIRNADGDSYFAYRLN